MKKYLSLLLVLVLALALAACNKDTNPPAEGGDETAEKLSICFVTSELGDHSFSDNSDLSLKQIAIDYDVEYVASQVSADGILNGVREAAQNGYDIVVFGGPNAEIDAMLAAEGKDYPDTLFYEYGVSDTYEASTENQITANFRACDSSFVGGLVAESVSTSKVCAFIGGQESVGLYEWMIGYVQGVYYNGGTTAYSWIGGESPWSDPAKAKELSMALYNNYNADVFWGCAGQSGDGCFAAVIDLRNSTGRNDIWGIGVDGDQYAMFADAEKEDYANVVLTSCVQMCCEPLRGIVETMLAGGEVETGLHTYGLADNACGIAENDFYKANVSQETLDAVANAKNEIVAGNMEVVSAWGMSTEDLNAFLETRTINYQLAEL